MNNLLNQADVIIHPLGWALLHSLWQSLLLFSILKIVFAVMPNISARIKYLLSFAALSGMFVWFTSTWVQQWQSLSTAASSIFSQKTSATLQPHVTSLAIHDELTQGNYLQSILLQLERNIPVIVFLYCLGMSFMLLRFFVNLDKVRQLRRKGTSTIEHGWIAKTETWIAGLGITRKVHIYLSDKIYVPSAIGSFKPVILLPVTTFSHLSTEQLEAIILHELAHIKRNDYIFNIVQTVIETILFFNPFMWCVTAMIRREREHCCDDLVVAYTKQPLCYAQALAAIETSRISTNTLALAAAGTKNLLFNRIKRIMEMKKQAISSSHIVITIFIICAFITSILCLTPGYAQTAKKTQKTKVIVIENGDTTVINANNVTVETSGDNREHSKPEKKKAREITEVETEDNVDPSAGRKDYYILNDIDTVFVDKEIQNVMKEMKDIDWEALREPLKKNMHLSMDSALYYSMEKFNEVVRQKVKTYHDSVTKVSMEKVKKYCEINRKRISQYNNMKPEDVDSLASAMKSPKKHWSDPDYFDKLIESMNSEGIINRDKGFDIEKKMNNTLYINGKKQSDEIYNRYSKYFIPGKIMISGKGTSITTTVIY